MLFIGRSRLNPDGTCDSLTSWMTIGLHPLTSVAATHTNSEFPNGSPTCQSNPRHVLGFPKWHEDLFTYLDNAVATEGALAGISTGTQSFDPHSRRGWDTRLESSDWTALSGLSRCRSERMASRAVGGSRCCERWTRQEKHPEEPTAWKSGSCPNGDWFSRSAIPIRRPLAEFY